MTRVYLYSESPMSAVGLEYVLAATGQFQVESFSSGLQDFTERLKIRQPGVVVLEMEPELILAALPNIQRVSANLAVVLWVNDISPEMALQAMSMGVRGILRKSLPADVQVRCLAKIKDGELWFEKALTDKLLSAQRVNLSPREGQLISLLAHGMKNKEIAEILRITEGTVKVYLSRLFDKLGAKDRFELALFGLKNLAGGQSPVTETTTGTTTVRGLQSVLLERRCMSRN